MKIDRRTKPVFRQALLAEGVIQSSISPEEFQRSDNPLIRHFVETTMGPIYSSEKEETAPL